MSNAEVPNSSGYKLMANVVARTPVEVPGTTMKDAQQREVPNFSVSLYGTVYTNTALVTLYYNQ